MDDLKAAFEKVRSHLQDLDHSQTLMLGELDGTRQTVGALVDTTQQLSKTVHELGKTVQRLDRTVQQLDKRVDGLHRSVTLGHAATAALGGTFASIEGILVRLSTEGATTQERLSDLTRRVEVLERKAS